MAQQAVRKQVERAPVKSRAPRVPVAKVSNAPPDYQRWRMTFSDPDEFMGFMRGYPNPQGVTLFLYRLVPKIDLSLIQLQESNIQKGSIDDLSLFSLDAVAEKFGRGKYNIRVTDSNRPDGEREVVKTCQYKLHDVEKPPIYDVRTLLLGHSDNIDEVNRLIAAGVLIRDASGAPRLRTAADAPVVTTAPGAAAPANTGNDLLLQFALESLRSAKVSPREQLQDSIEIAKLMRPEQAAAAAPSLDQIADAVATRLGGTRAGADPIATWEKVQGWVERIGAANNPQGVAPVAAAAGDGSGWAPYLASILAEARAFLPEVVGAWQMMRGKAAAAGENGKVPMLPMNQRIETIFKTGFQSMQNGVTGDQFAAWLCLSGEFPGGLEAFNYLKPSGVQGLMLLAGTNPVGAQVLNNAAIRPQLDLFLSQFFAFDPTAALPAA